MKRSLPAWLLLFLFFSCFFSKNSTGQTSAATPSKDPHAVSILQSCLQAAGGAQAIASIQDFKATGTITYNWANQPVQGSVTVRGRGTGQFRLDADLPDGRLSWAVNNGDGFYKKLDGSKKHISYSNAVNFGSLTFPYIYLAASLTDPSTNISNIGEVMKDGHKTYDVQLQRILPAGSDPNGILSHLTKRDFFIDTATFQITSTSDLVHPEKATTIDMPHEMQFSDYRVIDGVLVPFSIAETIVGQHTYTIQLSQVIFDTGLQDSDFEP